jgi:hypothetical protein
MRIQLTGGALLAVVLTLGACKGAPEHGSAPDSAAMSPSAPAAHPKPDLSAMPMLPALRAHLDSVAAHPAMLHGSMSGHQAEVKTVVDAMHADMMAAGMQSDAAYEALADSVVKGSAALGTATGPGFDRQVAKHVDQVRRLAAVYETKTAAM